MSARSRERAREAIRTVLRQMGECGFQDVALRAGEGLAGPLMDMVRDGEVVRAEPAGGRPATYRLA